MLAARSLDTLRIARHLWLSTASSFHHRHSSTQHDRTAPIPSLSALTHVRVPPSMSLHPSHPARYQHTATPQQSPPRPVWTSRGFKLGLAVATVGLGLFALAPPAGAANGRPASATGDDEWEDEDVPGQATAVARPLAHLPFSALLRSYLVYTLCRFPALVDAAPSLIGWTEQTSLPFVSALAQFIFRRTFFDQFVGGETAEASIEVIKSLDKMDLGTIFVYSVEHLHGKKAKAGGRDTRKVEAQHFGNDGALHESIVQELLHSVDVGSIASSSSSHDIMVAIKLSGLLRDPHILERASAAIVPRELFSGGPPTPTPPTPHQGSNTPHGALSIPLAALPKQEQAALRELWQALRRVTLAARARGNVRLLIDAEYSWYQPAIDAMYEALAAEFNALSDEDVLRRGPLVFNTFQAYLRRTPSFLSMSLERARAHGYALGVKLVRGAYVEIENKCWRDTVVDPPPTAAAQTEAERTNEAWGSPVWPTKQHSDECYDACARLLVDEVARDWRAERDARMKGEKEDVARRNRRTAVVFASHNLQSGLRAVRRMVQQGLAHPPKSSKALESTPVHSSADKPALVNLALGEGVSGRISFGQLFGMADTVSARLLAAFAPARSERAHDGADGDPGASDSEDSFVMVYKYLPYGPLELVMPYLIRRASENKSVVGGNAASKELAAVWSEIRLRLWPWAWT